MEKNLSLTIFLIPYVLILSSATDPRNIHGGNRFSQPDRLERRSHTDASVPGRIDPVSADWLQSKTDGEYTGAKFTKGTDSTGRSKRSVVSLFKSWIRLNRALKFLRKDGILVSSAGRNHVWVKSGGVRRADRDYVEVGPDGVTYTTKNGVRLATGKFEGGKLVLKEDLDTHACTIVLSRVLGDGSTFSCTVKYLD